MSDFNDNVVDKDIWDNKNLSKHRPTRSRNYQDGNGFGGSNTYSSLPQRQIQSNYGGALSGKTGGSTSPIIIIVVVVIIIIVIGLIILAVYKFTGKQNDEIDKSEEINIPKIEDIHPEPEHDSGKAR